MIHPGVRIFFPRRNAHTAGPQQPTPEDNVQIRAGLEMT